MYNVVRAKVEHRQAIKESSVINERVVIPRECHRGEQRNAQSAFEVGLQAAAKVVTDQSQKVHRCDLLSLDIVKHPTARYACHGLEL